MQQPRPPLEADLGAVQLQPHLAHGPRRRHPDPAAHGPPHHARDGGPGRRSSGRGGGDGRRVAVVAELGLAGVVTAAEVAEVDAAAAKPADGVQTAPEIGQPQRGQFVALKLRTFSSAVSELIHTFVMTVWEWENGSRPDGV